MAVNQLRVWVPKFWQKKQKKKNHDSLVGFKKEIKKWKLLNCLAESEKFL